MILRYTVVAGMIVFLAGCQNAVVDEVGKYALAHRRLPAELLAREGVPPHLDVKPLICGSGFPSEPELAGLPLSVAADLRAAMGAGVEPRYVVDFTGVEEVRTLWVEGGPITVLRHAYTQGKSAGSWGSEHPPAPSRMSVRGNHASGCGPVTIWRGEHCLYYTDAPWILLEVPGESRPWLLTVYDNLGIEGPIEVHVDTGPRQDKSRYVPFFWVDSQATGRGVVLAAQEGPGKRGAMRVSLYQANGELKETGKFVFDVTRGEFDFHTE